jgi:hypothetical protein
MDIRQRLCAFSAVAVLCAIPALAPAQTPGGLKGAARCKVDPYEYHHTSETPVHMTTSNDGGWCWLTPHPFARSSITSGAVTVAPSHGETTIVPGAADYNRYGYKPAAGYFGSDNFTVVLNLPKGQATLSVTVDVVK